MFNTGRAQRAGNRSSRQGNNPNNTIARIAPDILKNASATRPAKRTRVASIGDSSASGLVIQGSREHPQEEGTNPNGANPPNSMVDTEQPDFPISFSGRGIPKFVSSIRLAGIDGSTSISGNLTVGGEFSAPGGITGFVSTTKTSDQSIASSLSTTSVEQSFDAFSGSITTLGGVGIVKDVQIGGTTTSNAIVTNSIQTETAGVFSDTPSTNEETGALVVTGGVGIGGDVHVGNTITTGDGSVWPDHALLTSGDQSSSGIHNFTNTTQSTSTSTGALVVAGGTGIAKDVYIGGTLNIGGAHLSGNELAALQSTGVEYGGALSVASGTTIAISDGAGVIIDSSNPAAITETLVTWSGLTGTTITTLSNTFTYIYIDNTGSVVQSLVEPTPILRRDNIFLGKVFHPDGATVIAVNNQPEVYNTSLNQIHDFYKGMGPIVLSGLRVSANGSNLSIDISAGSLHQSGINFHTDPQQPNIKDFTVNTGAIFARSIQTTVGSNTSTTIDPGNYDVEGTVTPITGSNNQATNMRVYLFNSGFISVQYGQQVYGTIALAEAGLVSESFVVEPFTLSNGILLGVISVTKGATDLSISTQVGFFSASKFGEVSIGVGGTATANLQNTYDNSTQPQILLTSALGALEIQDAATPTGGTLFSVKDSVGSSVLDVSATQVTAVKDMNVNQDLIITGDTTLINTTDSTTTSNGALVLTGGAGIAKQVTCNKLKTTNVTDSTSTTLGSVTIAGGIGVAKTLWCDKLMVDDTTNSTSVTTGSVIINGGTVVKKNLYADKVYSTNVQAQNGATTFRLGGNVSSGQIQIGEGLNNAKPVLIGNNSRYQLGIEGNDFYGALKMEVLSAGNPLNLIMLGGSSSIFRYGKSITTGDVEIMEDQTTGDVKIGNTGATTGRILMNTPIVQCNNVIRAPNLETNSISTTLNVGTNITTGNVEVGPSLTSGDVKLGSTSATGRILMNTPIVQLNNTGTLRVPTIETVSSSTTMTVGGNITTGGIIIGDSQTTGDITIGNASASIGGNIVLQSDNFKSDSYTPTIGDGTNQFTNPAGKVVWERMGNMVYVMGQVAWSGGIGSCVGTANVQIGGFPFTTLNDAAISHQTLEWGKNINNTITKASYNIPCVNIAYNASTMEVFLDNYASGGNQQFNMKCNDVGSIGQFSFCGWLKIEP